MLEVFKNESEWLAARKSKINSTDLAALFGLSQYKTRLALWYEKAGIHEPDFEDTQYTRWGRRLQLTVGMGICCDRGWRGEDLTLSYLSCPESGLGASMDMRVECQERGNGLLEIKTTGFFSEESGWEKTKAPIEYEFQIQGQLHLAIKDGQDLSWGAIGALDGRKNERIYFRKYDSDLGKIIDSEAKKFWQSIADNNPPPPDYLADADLLEALRPAVRAGEGVNLSLNSRAVDLVNRLSEVDSEISEARKYLKPLEDSRTRIKNELLSMMGNAEFATIGDYKISAPVYEVEERFTAGHSARRFNIKRRK